MESVRKCSECGFGILKKHFRILKNGFPFKDTVENAVRCDNCFYVCAMLHNHMLREAGYHTVGERESDWEKACTEADDARIKQLSGAFEAPALAAHVVDDEAVGNEVEQEVQGGHCDLHDALVVHYTMQLEDGRVMWPKHATQLRGHQDKRRKEAGGGRRARHEDETWHAAVSESESESDSSDPDDEDFPEYY